MNRTLLISVGVFGVPSLLLVDSAVKGSALLILAAVAASILRRDSAATRHLVWLLALVTMLAVSDLLVVLHEIGYLSCIQTELRPFSSTADYFFASTRYGSVTASSNSKVVAWM